MKIADAIKWQASSENEKLADIQALLDKGLSNNFEFCGLKLFECGASSYTVGQLRHKLTGMTMHLIPGDRQY